MEPQAIVALVTLGLIGFMLLATKLFTKIWLYMLLLSPSWGITAYNIFDAVAKGETFNSILMNHATGLIFILAPIDQHVVADPSLQLYGFALLGVWAYLILAASVHLLGGWGLPIAPLIFWILGKGLQNTMALLGNYLPSWLLIYNGLPLILLTCLALGAVLFLKRRRIDTPHD